MKRTLGAFAVVLCACGSVPKAKPDATEQHVDAAPDAFDCTPFPLAGTFTHSPVAVLPNAPTTFKSADPGARYAWTFASGTPATSTDASPQVSWTAVGQYDVMLTVTDNAVPCSVSKTQSVSVCTPAAPLAGPALTTATSGWANYGLEITVQRDTVLTGFTITGKGLADTIELTDMNNVVVQSFVLPAGPATYQASVDWPLTAGQTYHLLNNTADNLSYAGASFPIPGPSITVTNGSRGGVAQGYYFGFNNLVTCP